MQGQYLNSIAISGAQGRKRFACTPCMPLSWSGDELTDHEILCLPLAYRLTDEGFPAV